MRLPSLQYVLFIECFPPVYCSLVSFGSYFCTLCVERFMYVGLTKACFDLLTIVSCLKLVTRILNRRLNEVVSDLSAN